MNRSDLQLAAAFALLSSLFFVGCGSAQQDDSQVRSGDPAGAAASEMPAAPREPAFAVMFPAINVLDLAASEAFYIGLLGMKPTLRIGDADSDRQEVTLNFSGDMSAPEASLVLDHVASREQPYVSGALSRIAFRVTDLEGLVERIRAAGHAILSEPRMLDVEGADADIKLAFVQDPDGIRIELIELGARSASDR